MARLVNRVGQDHTVGLSAPAAISPSSPQGFGVEISRSAMLRHSSATAANQKLVLRNALAELSLWLDLLADIIDVRD